MGRKGPEIPRQKGEEIIEKRKKRRRLTCEERPLETRKWSRSCLASKPRDGALDGEMIRSQRIPSSMMMVMMYVCSGECLEWICHGGSLPNGEMGQLNQMKSSIECFDEVHVMNRLSC
ncbi:hypothetical protein BDW42DRAFT_29697 [Aspergillus taichungensis]|uniref:Uncharacterized protein n=1 Tax=Aspergillus taichungensis TaxID=482145 RepID=A0A2J5HG13_9EURO|nr:hypothetical protein BDW42DRAFT_29697 [Aspergillus taichungensis]